MTWYLVGAAGDLIFRAGLSWQVEKSTVAFTQRPNAVVITGLRVQFIVEKSIEAEPNTADVIITNLAEGTRGQVVARLLYVRLDAGYDGARERLFTGDLLWARPPRSAPTGRRASSSAKAIGRSGSRASRARIEGA